jgi:hypothetical protein
MEQQVGSKDQGCEYQHGGVASKEPCKGATMWSSKVSGESHKGATSEEQRQGAVSEE